MSTKATKYLSLPQCKDYLKRVMELEISCYEQERLEGYAAIPGEKCKEGS